MQEIIDLEKQGWQALSVQGDAAIAFYAAILLENAVMLFPGGLRIAGKANILASFGAQPWKSFKLENLQVAQLGKDVVVLTYEVTARREEQEPYHALISSLYLGVEGAWKLGLHQHTLI